MTTSAFLFARDAHGDQKYGEMGYVYHLAKVVDILCKSGFEHDSPIVQAGWLHDVLEDTEASETDLRQVFGDEVTNLVRAVSREPLEGLTAYHQRIRSVPGATTLKLADRIANVVHCWDTRDRRLMRYVREHTNFRRDLRDPNADPTTLRLWDTLDGLT